MKAFGAILVTNLIVWMPCAVFVALGLFIDGELIPVGTYTFIYVTFIMHTVLHPLVEGCFIPEIKEMVKNMLRPSQCTKRVNNQEKNLHKSSGTLNETSMTMIDI